MKTIKAIITFKALDNGTIFVAEGRQDKKRRHWFWVKDDPKETVYVGEGWHKSKIEAAYRVECMFKEAVKDLEAKKQAALKAIQEAQL